MTMTPNPLRTKVILTVGLYIFLFLPVFLIVKLDLFVIVVHICEIGAIYLLKEPMYLYTICLFPEEPPFLSFFSTSITLFPDAKTSSVLLFIAIQDSSYCLNFSCEIIIVVVFYRSFLSHGRYFCYLLLSEINNTKFGFTPVSLKTFCIPGN